MNLFRMPPVSPSRISWSLSTSAGRNFLFFFIILRDILSPGWAWWWVSSHFPPSHQADYKLTTSFPGSNKTSIFQVRCSREEDILKYCDKYTPGAVQEYYFDRYCRVLMVHNHPAIICCPVVYLPLNTHLIGATITRINASSLSAAGEY